MFRQRSSYRLHYRTLHNSLGPKIMLQVDVWQKIRNHLQLPEGKLNKLKKMHILTSKINYLTVLREEE